MQRQDVAVAVCWLIFKKYIGRNGLESTHHMQPRENHGVVVVVVAVGG